MSGQWRAILLVGLFFTILNLLVSCSNSSTLSTSKSGEVLTQPPEASAPQESGQSEITTKLELYYLGDVMMPDRFETLQTIYSKIDNNSFSDHIIVKQSPWVINYKYDQTSNIGYEFYFNIWQGSTPPRLSEIMPSSGFGYENMSRGPLYGVSNLVFYDTGTFNLDLKASGCKWWIKVGIEPNVGAASPSQTMITGKWQHGISDCPPNIDKSLCEKLKKLPENNLYYWEFFEDGHIDKIISGWSLTGGFMRFGGRYSLIGSKLEINWDLEGYEAYDIKKLTENELVLQDQTGSEHTFHRVD
jgi:hypothetical protein